MKRWTVTLAVTLATSLFATAAVWTYAEATTQRCLDYRTCNPPPCDYYRQLEMYQALQSVFSSKRLQARIRARVQADPANRGKSQAQIDAAAARALEEEALRRAGEDGPIARNLRQCPGSTIGEPPGFHTSGDCRVNDEDGPIGRESAHRKYDTCSEFIDAAFDHEQVHKDACNRQNSTARANMGIGDYGAEEAAGYQKAIDRVRGDLEEWARSCAPQVDARTNGDLVKAGIGAIRGGGR